MKKLSNVFEDVKVRPLGIIVMGGPKSGKSTWVSNYIKSVRIKKFENLSIDVFKSTEERSLVLEQTISEGKDFIYEGISLKLDRIESFIDKLKTNGYRIKVVLIENTAAKNMFNSDIKKIYDKNDQLLEQIKDKVDIKKIIVG